MTRAGRRAAVNLLALITAAVVLLPVAAMAGRADRVDHASQLHMQVLDQEARQVALGVSTPIGKKVSDLTGLSAALGGRMPATWTIWSWWGDSATRAFPAKVAAKVSALGVTPMIWWEPVKPLSPDKPYYPRFANTSAGQHDEYIRRFAQAAKRFGKTVLLRYAPEVNGSFHPWGMGRFDNTEATFLAAWRHVWEIFREVGAANVKFVWSVSSKPCPGGCNPYTAFYPGDAYVDYMAFSSFNWGAQKDKWTTMLKGYTRVTRNLASISTRPIIAIESASNSEGGDKAAWIREGYPAVYAGLPSIVAIAYLNADLRNIVHPDWRIASPPQALTAYAEIASMPEFSGRIQEHSGGTIQDALDAAPARR